MPLDALRLWSLPLLLTLSGSVCAPVRVARDSPTDPPHRGSKATAHPKTAQPGAAQPAAAPLPRGGAEWGFFAISDAGGALEGLSSVRWSRITGLTWSKLESPIGSGHYAWQTLDERIVTAGKHGYNLVFVLKTGNDPKVSEPGCYRAVSQSNNKNDQLVSCPPKSDYEEAWKRLVQAIIERYDGDGRDDMPGLPRGFVLDVQIENESGGGNYWCPNLKGEGRVAAESYLRLLRRSKEARDAANPGTRIIATGFVQPEILAECASGRGAGCTTPYQKRNREFTQEVLKHPDLFDAIDLHMYTYYRFSAGRVEAALQWFHEQMKNNGYDKPVYALEWSGSMLKGLEVNERADEFMAAFPYRKELPSRERLQKVYTNLSNPKNAKYRRWFEAEQAKEFPKLFTVMLANGVVRLIHTQFHDYPGFGWNNPWWNWQGIVRYAGSRQQPVAIRKPAYYAYQMLSEKIAGFTSVDPVDVGKDAIAFRYGFAERKPVYVVWARGDRAEVPLMERLGATDLRLTPFVTELDAGDRPVRTPALRASGGLTTVTDTPVLVEVP